MQQVHLMDVLGVPLEMEKFEILYNEVAVSSKGKEKG